MNQAITNIEKQVNSCKNLLTVFQDERKLYQKNVSIKIKDINRFLNQKTAIMKMFDAQRELIKELSSQIKTETQVEKVRKKELLRDLASILEQLLVIDHENEKLLRETLNNHKMSITVNKGFKTRMALHRQLPFIPDSSVGLQKATPITKKTVVKSRLQNYIDANRFMVPEAKYA